MLCSIRRMAGPLLAIVLAMGMTATASPAGAEQATVPDIPVMLINVQTGKCLTIAGGTSTANNVEAVQYNCDSHPSRRWYLHSGTPGALQVQNVQTGKCLTIAGGTSTANNVTALQYTCDTHPSRSWIFTPDSYTGNYWVQNVQTGKCLTIAGGTSTANNVEAVQYNCDSHPSRLWYVLSS
jgi:hypothetical protein